MIKNKTQKNIFGPKEWGKGAVIFFQPQNYIGNLIVFEISFR